MKITEKWVYFDCKTCGKKKYIPKENYNNEEELECSHCKKKELTPKIQKAEKLTSQKNIIRGKYNTTELDPDKEFERHIYHRDQFAHYLRWTHVLKLAKVGMNVLDFGCGSGNLYEVFYRNKYKPNKFLGIDLRKHVIEANKEKFSQVEWEVEDLVNMENNYGRHWDIIASFEVLEHVHKDNGEKFMNNIKSHCSEKTTVLISTPCYDESVGAAGNHTYDDMIHEYTFEEAKELFEKEFKIIDVFGTFASQKDYKDKMNEWQKNMYNHLTKYYDSNLISNIMAPFFPENSRNCLWKLMAK